MIRMCFALGAGLVLAAAAAAQSDPVGPCSPFRAADGNVPLEMPGCARRLRPAPGPLADELRFRRERDGAGAEADDDGAEAPPRGRRRARRVR